jgi:hypothetical protein
MGSVDGLGRSLRQPEEMRPRPRGSGNGETRTSQDVERQMSRVVAAVAAVAEGKEIGADTAGAERKLEVGRDARWMARVMPCWMGWRPLGPCSPIGSCPSRDSFAEGPPTPSR